MGFQCIIKLTMSLKTLLLTVIPKRYYYQSIVFKEIPKWYYILSYCFQCNIFRIVFWCIFKLTSVCQNSVSASISKTVFPLKQCFWMQFQAGITFTSCNAQIEFSLKRCWSKYFQNCFTFKAVFLDVIPGWYYFYIM